MVDNATIRLGITANQFYDLLWCDYERLCYKSALDDQNKWVHTREILAMLYNINRGKNQSAKSGKQIIPLDIDGKEIPRQPLTVEEHKEAIRILGKYFKN